jgi:hypothetical protein
LSSRKRRTRDQSSADRKSWLNRQPEKDL